MKEIMNILVGLTGSVAAIKAEQLYQELTRQFPNAQIQFVTTENAQKFLNLTETNIFIKNNKVKVWTDTEEWQLWKGRGDPVLHIDVYLFLAACMLVCICID
jgi:phosphopantothenoylcysteine decarboxylase